MKYQVVATGVRGLMAAGRLLPPSAVARMRQAMGLVETAAWLDREDGGRPALVRERESLFEIALPHLEEAQQPLYLEFGVAAGESMRWWSSHLRNPAAHFIGFDSFEGLPHDWQAWQGNFRKGHFAQDRLPHFADERVQLVKGWFDDTLPDFVAPPHDALVVTLDADLYSSTALVLSRIVALLTPGTLLYVDDLPMDDGAALADFGSMHNIRFDAVAMEAHGFNWLFRVR